MLEVYGVTDEATCEALVQLAREARRRGWWTRYTDVLGSGTYVGLEAEAAGLHTYESMFVPGLQAQLQHLIALSTMPNSTLTLQILPFTVGAHPGMNGPFVILTFGSPTDPPMVYLETATDGLYLDEPADVERYSLRFSHLVARGART